MNSPQFDAPIRDFEVTVSFRVRGTTTAFVEGQWTVKAVNETDAAELWRAFHDQRFELERIVSVREEGK